MNSSVVVLKKSIKHIIQKMQLQVIGKVKICLTQYLINIPTIHLTLVTAENISKLKSAQQVTLKTRQ